MVKVDRMPVVINIGGQIVERALRMKRLDYIVRPSEEIDPTSIQSLRHARFCIEYGNKSEWMDIEEFTVLAVIILEQKRMLESADWRKISQANEATIKTNMTISAEPPEELILQVAAKTAFADPPVLN